jgi:hypothetical protein
LAKVWQANLVQQLRQLLARLTRQALSYLEQLLQLPRHRWLQC